MYSYEQEKPKLFTERNQRMFLQIRDEAMRLIELAGAARMDRIICKVSGDSWMMFACLDRLVELGEIKEVTRDVAGQDRIFTAGTHERD
jgi:hypothetical protein